MHPIRDRSGAVMFLHPTGIDITERKHVEAALRESERRLRWSASIVESSDDANVSKNLDGIVASWNRGAARLFGYTADEAIGQPITIVIPQDRQDEERAILTRPQTGRAYRPFRDGTPKQARQLDRPFTDSFTCQKCRGENCRSIEDITRDITPQKRSQEQIATLAWERSIEVRTCLRAFKQPSTSLGRKRPRVWNLRSRDGSARWPMFTRCLPRRAGLVPSYRTS